MPVSLQPIGLDQPTKYLTDRDKESINQFLAEYCTTKHLLYSPLDQAFRAESTALDRSRPLVPPTLKRLLLHSSVLSERRL